MQLYFQLYLKLYPKSLYIFGQKGLPVHRSLNINYLYKDSRIS